MSTIDWVYPEWNRKAAGFVSVVYPPQQCPLWVKNRHRVTSESCPFFPSKQIFVSVSGTSAMCQKQALTLVEIYPPVFAC
jgi:hypothetical protein